MDKPRLLVIELWGLGDLIIATPFLRAATQKFEVTVLAKPYAKDLQARFWPEVKVIPFTAPWTAFTHKYRLLNWRWKEMFRLRKEIGQGQFDVGLSARWDPRDHLLLALMRAKSRVGFPRLGSGMFLTRSLQRTRRSAHRYENWRVLAEALGFELPSLHQIAVPEISGRRQILIHSGAGQPVRVWPLERYRTVVSRLRSKGYLVQVACDSDQREWWLQAGESNVATPQSVAELLALTDRTGVFIGNDSGPGHLAAFSGMPTFTIFGPQLPEWFAPMHPAARWNEGKPCPYKPCSDYCRFQSPLCLTWLPEEEIWTQVESFVSQNLSDKPTESIT